MRKFFIKFSFIKLRVYQGSFCKNLTRIYRGLNIGEGKLRLRVNPASSIDLAYSNSDYPPLSLSLPMRHPVPLLSSP